MSRGEKDPRYLSLFGDIYTTFQAQQCWSSYFIKGIESDVAERRIMIFEYPLGKSAQERMDKVIARYQAEDMYIETNDNRNPDDLFLSVIEEKEDGTISYVAVRIFINEENVPVRVTIERTMGSKNIPLMREIRKALRSTPQEVFAVKLAGEKLCTFGEDSYD